MVAIKPARPSPPTHRPGWHSRGLAADVGIDKLRGRGFDLQIPAIDRRVGGFVLQVRRLLDRYRFDDVGEPGRLGAVGAFQPPGGMHGLFDQQLLEFVLGLNLGEKGLEADLQDVGILVGQVEGLGGHAVLEGVEPGATLTRGRAWFGTLLSVAAVDRSPIDRGGCRGHGGLSREWMQRKWSSA